MLEIFYSIIAAFIGAFAIILMVAFFRVLRGGPGKVAYLRKKRYGVKAWASGSMPKTNYGTTVHELEGVELKATNGRLSYVRQTRASTSDL